MDSLMMRKIEALTQFDWLTDALTRQVARFQSLITPITAHVKHHINIIEEEHSLVQRLQEQFLAST